MSPFYNRSSPIEKTQRKDKSLNKINNQHTNYPAYTTWLTVEPPQEPPKSSKMRIPFLGKKRKSLAALKTEQSSSGAHLGHARHATASLSVQDLNRLNIPLGQDRLELPPLNVSPFKVGVNGANVTPNRPIGASRHNSATSSTCTPLSSAYSHGSGSSRPASTGDAYGTPTKRSAERIKSSFFSRVTARPALLSRKSSADLRSSSSKPCSPPVAQDKWSPGPSQRVRPPITLRVNSKSDLGEDKNFFTSPRTAPSPPNLTFTPPDDHVTVAPCSAPAASPSMLAQASKEVNLSLAPRPMSQIHPHTKDGMDSRTRVRHHRVNAMMDSNTAPIVPRSTCPVNSTPLKQIPSNRSSPPRKRLDTLQGRTLSEAIPTAQRTVTSEEMCDATRYQRRRQGTVQIGRQKVTLSVANVLEAGLGVDVGDDSDEPPLADSDEDTPFGVNPLAPARKRAKSEVGLSGKLCKDGPVETAPESGASIQRRISVTINKPAPPPSALPPVEPEVKLPTPAKDIFDKEITSLSPKSPLSELMTMSEELKKMTNFEEAPPTSVSTETAPISTRTGRHARSRTLSNAKSFYLPSGTTLGDEIPTENAGTGNISRLKRHSNASSSSLATETHESTAIKKLQQALTIQNERFERLVKYVINTTQEFQDSKVEYEQQIETLLKEAQQKEDELKGLQWLLKGGASRGGVIIDGAQGKKILGGALNEDPSNDPTPPESTEQLGELRRSRTMPDLSCITSTDHSDTAPHDTPFVAPLKLKRRPSTREPESPDISASSSLSSGLGLEFPLPQPLSFPSFPSSITPSTSTSSSRSSIIALPTPACSAPYGLATIVEGSTPPDIPVTSVPKNMISSPELEPSTKYIVDSPVNTISSHGTNSPMSRDEVAASEAYASNLNKGRVPTMASVMGKAHTSLIPRRGGQGEARTTNRKPGTVDQLDSMSMFDCIYLEDGRLDV